MDEPELKTMRLVVVLGAALLLLLAAAGIAFGLLHRWQLPAGGEAGSGALIETIPEPRLQTAPQQDRANGRTAAPAFAQRLGSALPRRLDMVDARGAPVDWNASERDGRPIVLLAAYYRCDTLCGAVAHGALEALADTGLPPSSWRLMLFSIDPQDSPAEARALQSVYTQYARFARPAVYTDAPPMRLLTGGADARRALARAIGFDWLAEPAEAGAAPQYAHATGLVVLTADGRVSRYLFGVRFAPRELRAALIEAGDGSIGTPVERLLLACAHLDPLNGARDGLVLAGVRATALIVLALLGAWVWRHRRGRAPRGVAQ